jgi:hypothetical protein
MNPEDIDVDDISLSRTTIDQALNRALSSTMCLSTIVFGPGSGAPDYRGIRVPVKNKIVGLGHTAEFPEDIDDTIVKHKLEVRGYNIPDLDNLLSNPVNKEIALIHLCDAAIFLLQSPGAVSEFSTFFTINGLAPKLRVYVPSEYANDESYIASGPIAAFTDVYPGNLKFYTSLDDLLPQVEKLVKQLATYKFMSSSSKFI